MTAFALRSRRVVQPGSVGPATVVVRDGVIAEVIADAGGTGELPADLDCEDLGDLVLSPGLVDSHVHVNDPGRTSWEGFTSATRAAAAGGVTTVVDMPLNSLPATVSVTALERKRAAAFGNVWVDVAFWGGITSADVADVAPLVDAGVCGFKVFLSPSGVPEFPHLDASALDAALASVARADVPLVVHAEHPAVLDAAPAVTGRAYASWLASRPAEAEVAAIALLADACARAGARAHVLHLSAGAALPVLDAAARAGARLTAETCPHYLSLAAEDLPDGATPAKCAPPVRPGANRDELWDGVRAGLLSAVVSDHSPAPPDLKAVASGDMAQAWGGISGLQTQLPVVWTAARSRGVGFADLARLQSEAPARLAGLAGKGAIRVGNDADLVAWDPEATFVVDPHRLLHRHPLSPWAGAQLHGVVRTTWLHGVVVDVDGPARGRLLERAA